MKIKLFTHGADLDGVGCAILAYIAFGRENVDVEFCDYNDINERVKDFYTHNEIQYDRIFITDISVNEEVAQDINAWVAREYVYLFDHHASALWLNKYSWCEVTVTHLGNGLKTCGTEMFCRFLIYSESLSNIRLLRGCLISLKNIHRFVEIVRDYDTWRWKEIGDEGIVCKQMHDLLDMCGREAFIEDMLCRIAFDPSDEFPVFNEKKQALLTMKQKDIDRYVEQKNEQLITMQDPFGYKCGVIFAERYFSELGNRLCELNPNIDYVAMIDISRGSVSYRCTRDDIDLGGEIAHSFGGGGHRKAAGSRFDGQELKNMIIDFLFITEEEKRRIASRIKEGFSYE